MTEKVIGVDASYIEKTADLQLQLAGLEFVLYVRGRIERGSKLREHELRVHLHGEVLRSCPALARQLAGKGLYGQKQALIRCLEAHLADIPPFHLEDGKPLSGREQHVVFVCGFEI